MTATVIEVVFQPCPLSIVGDASACPRDLARGGFVAVEVGNEVPVVAGSGPAGVLHVESPVSRAGARRQGNRVGYPVDQCRRR